MPNGIFGPFGPHGPSDEPPEENDSSRRIKRENQKLKKRVEKLEKAVELLVIKAKYYKGLAIRLLQAVKQLTSPPNNYAVFVRPHPNGKPDEADILMNGQQLAKVKLAIERMTVNDLKCGWEVLLGGKGAIIEITKDYWHWGNQAIFREYLSDDIALVIDEHGTVSQCFISPELKNIPLKEGDLLLNCNGLLVKALPKTAEKENFVDMEKISNLDWSTVGGLDDVINQIKRSLLPFKNAKVYKESFKGTELNKGIILWGPPGNGKTMIAKRIGADLARDQGLDCYFISIAGPKLSSKWVGQTAENIRNLFDRAKEKAKDNAVVVIFFDEIDSLFRSRASSMEHEPWMAEVVGQLNALLDGVDPLSNVLVIAATNELMLVDDAIKRDGRLGEHVFVPRPRNREAVESILRIYLTADLPFANQYLVDEYQYLDRFGSGKPETVRFDRDPEKIRSHFVDTLIKRLFYKGEPVTITLRDEDESQTFKVDNSFITRSGQEIYLRQRLSGALLGVLVENAKKIALARFSHLKEKAMSENPALRGLPEEELMLKLKELGVKPEIKKRHFLKAVDQALEQLRKANRNKSTKQKKSIGFEIDVESDESEEVVSEE